MKNKHYLLSTFRYIAKDKEKFKDFDYETIVEHEYRNRIESSSAVFIDFEIHPFSKTKQISLSSEQYPLFFMILPEHLSMLQEINIKSREIRTLLDLLPKAAKENISFSQLISEIKSSNDIEGVKSTRKELEEAIQARNTNVELRFKSTIKQYLSTLYSEKPYIKDLKKIRKLYDDIVLEEIDKDNHPDGKLFRKGEVFVTNIAYGEKVHVGCADEEEITEKLTKLIYYMNKENDSDIIKAIVTHYIFEYIHPFYDGNGRLGRYILSSYLAYKLDPFSALSISESIKRNKKKYEDAFSEVTNPLNKGELTFFISTIMKLIISGQKNVVLHLREAIHKMEIAYNFASNQDFNKLEYLIIFIMLQHFLFAENNKSISNIEIFENLREEQYSRYKVDNALKDLEEKNYVVKTSMNPIAYKLNNEKLPIFE